MVVHGDASFLGKVELQISVRFHGTTAGIGIMIAEMIPTMILELPEKRICLLIPIQEQFKLVHEVGAPNQTAVIPLKMIF